jgi:iron complex transport system substrate-binding protein
LIKPATVDVGRIDNLFNEQYQKPHGPWSGIRHHRWHTHGPLIAMHKPWRARPNWSRALCCGCVSIAAVMMLATVAYLNAADAPGKPRRIVSLNLCTDELVLRLADTENVASVTWLSRDPQNSNVAALAAQVPVNHGLAEEIIPLKPDLVIAGIYTARTAVALLKRVGVPVAELDVPKNLDDVRRQIREVASLVGERERGEAMIRAMERDLAALAPAPRTGGPRAIVLNPNGVTVGKGTLADEIMSRAGLTNLAAEFAIDNYGQIPLETVAANAVDVLIISTSRDGPPALATDILRHPVLTALADRTRLVVLPGRLWNCGGPALVEAIERLSGIANDVRGKVPAR